jgi:hypothetical protein
MEEQLKDRRNFGPSSLESKIEANVLMITKIGRRKYLYIKQLIPISEVMYQLLIFM